MELNKYQTPIEDLGLDAYPEEVREQFFDFISTVPYIKNCIDPKKKRACELQRDKSGKIIVDITQPHILEDMDYFRPTAIHFQKYGCYTKLRPNPNPNSEYGKWIREELKRCYYGYVRPSDGEWITGDNYYFWNYAPMSLAKKEKGSKKASRVIDFPRVWEGHYYKFHYLQQARDNGKHALELASRGKGKAHPYDTKVLTSQGWKLWKDIQIGDYLWGDDGNLTKVIDIPFNGICPMYKITLADGRTIKCSEGHLWNVYSHYHKGEIKTFDTEYLYKTYRSHRKVTSPHSSEVEYHYSIVSNKGVDFTYRETKVDPYTFGLLLGDGCFRCNGANKTYFTCHNDDWLIIKDLIPYKDVFIYSNTKFGYNLNIPNFVSILKDYGLFMRKSEDKFIPEEYLNNSRNVRLELLKGIIDSDGTTTNNRYDIDLSSKKMRDQLAELCISLGYNYRTSERKTGYRNKDGNYVECKTSYRLRIFTKDILCKLPRKIEGIKKRSDSNYANSKIKGVKIINIEYIGKELGKCVTVDNTSHCYLVGDYITTHNSFCGASMLSRRFTLGESPEVNKKVTCYITAADKKYLVSGDQTLDKFQFDIDWVAEHTQFPKRRLISSIANMQWTMGYKDLDYGTNKGTLNSVIGISSKDDESKLRGSRGVLYVLEEIGSFPALLALYNNLRPSVEDGEDVFGMIYGYGTSGDSQSDFSAAQEMMYNPTGYNIYRLPNVFDKEGQGSPNFVFFFPGYINRADCYDEDGNSDVTKALLQILQDRYIVKYNSTDINTITKRVAEIPITPQEAVLKTVGNKFPVVPLTERINELDNNPNAYAGSYIGDLILNSSGEVEFKMNNKTPIRKYPLKDNNAEGALEIFQLPEKNNEGKVFSNRYIIGHDPVDDDQSETMSLTSTFVLDLFTDKIVAEYTGRQAYADDNFEIVRKLCLFYNAKCLYESNKKGIFAYFSKHNCIHLLADTPEYLKDREIIKSIGYGNKAKGVNAIVAVNNFANDLIRDWLLKPVTKIVKEGDEDKEITIPNLFHIKSRALLQELVSFNPIANFDRVRALGMVMLYREEQMIRFQGDTNKIMNNSYADKNYLGNDKFFTTNYDDRFIRRS